MQNDLVVYGSGMMAAAMNALPSFGAAIFAAGVSNSRETSNIEYNREKNKLEIFIKANVNKKIIYFSSYVAANGVSQYAEHKREIEVIVGERAKDFLVLRLPQAVGRTNNRTLVSYLVGAAAKREKIYLQKNAFRNLIDVVDVARIVSLLIEKDVSREIVSVGPSTPLSIFIIVKHIESILNLKIECNVVDGGDRQGADLSRLLELIGGGDPIFCENYQYLVLKKYVPDLFRGVC